MTPDQQAEWDYRYAERLAIMCEGGNSTEAQRVIARAEADVWFREVIYDFPDSFTPELFAA